MKKLVVSCLISVFSLAGVSHANKVSQVLDGLITVNQSDALKDFKTSTYQGLSFGSFGFRIKQDLLDLPVYTINPPRASLSCSGLDLDAGFIAALDLGIFKQLLEQGGGTAAWGLMLGLVYSLPGVADTFQKLNEWGRMAQTLGQNACNLGKAVGATIGARLFQGAKNEAEDAGLGSAKSSVLSEIQKQYKALMDAQRLFYTFPYTYLRSKGADKDISNLVASFLGVIRWYPASDGGGICDRQECLNDNNMRVEVYRPLTVTLDQVLNGADNSGLTLYDCTWGGVNVGGKTVDGCSSVQTRRETGFTKGLVGKFEDRLDDIVNKLQPGGSTLTNDDYKFIYSYGLLDLVNGLVLTKKVNPYLYASYRKTVASFIAVRLMYDLLDDAENSLAKSAMLHVSNNAPDEAAKDIADRVTSSKKAMREKLEDLEKKMMLVKNLNSVYADITANINANIRTKIGIPPFKFGG